MADQPPTPEAPEVLPEQDFVDAAYSRLDALRASYRESQRKAHATHGVGNAQAWTERDALSSHLGDMAARLEGVEERLVFGRLDLDGGAVRRIGRVSLSEESGAPLLIDWRAPAAMPFYQATAVAPLGVVRRRHIQTKRRRVTSIEDELLEAGSASALDLQGEGALMSALGQARDGRMGDIVATIQAEQDRIIRAVEQGLVVVQGGPGTGKTAVALHRIAYLLYAERERLERSGVLLVGPSRIFLRYIEQVLPSLGETGVVSTTIGDLLPGTTAAGAEPHGVAEAKGRSGWSRLLAEAVRALPRALEAPVRLSVWNREVDLLPDDVAAAQRHARRARKTHNEAREGFALELMKKLAKRLATEAGDVDSAGRVSDEDLASWTSEIRDSIDARRAINLAWMPTSAHTLLARLYARPALLARINEAAGRPLTASDLALVARSTGPWTPADVPLLDELEELLGPLPGARRQAGDAADAEEVERARAAIEGQGLGGGIVSAEALAASTRAEVEWTPLAEKAAADRQWAYGHIVVDEAQDLSPMAWRALLRRCPSRSMTIVGDLDQRRGSHRPQTWIEALGPASRAYEAEYVLTVSYRTPRTLTTLAEGVMARIGEPVAHPMTAVRDVPDCYRVDFVPGDGSPTAREEDPLWAAASARMGDALSRLDAESGAGSGRIAVLVGAERAAAWDADLTGARGLDSRVSVLSAAASKGLEFDSVVLVEPAEILADGPGDLFVALTRSTHDLAVVHSAPLPPGMEEW
ncbi:HelD family protein [Actinomyces culturomici]|uniref:HelD family protein n=1 Tax=Actinomyces culturomici TaxID=1926276 RepID=UPI000E2013FA|nr:AAA family ATPase [Actinomyces culturomici]